MNAKVSIFGDFIVYDWPVEKKTMSLQISGSKQSRDSGFLKYSTLQNLKYINFPGLSKMTKEYSCKENRSGSVS